jgi:hypothetical protein
MQLQIFWCAADVESATANITRQTVGTSNVSIANMTVANIVSSTTTFANASFSNSTVANVNSGTFAVLNATLSNSTVANAVTLNSSTGNITLALVATGNIITINSNSANLVNIRAVSLITCNTNFTTGANTGDIIISRGSSIQAVNVAGSGLVTLIGAVPNSDNVALSPQGRDVRYGVPLVALGGGATPTLGTIGGSGPATAGQNES